MQFSDNAQEILEKLRKVQFQKLVENTSHMTDATAKVMYQLNYLLKQTEKQLEDVINNTAIISDNLRSFSKKLKNSPSQMIFSKPPPPLDPNSL